MARYRGNWDRLARSIAGQRSWYFSPDSSDWAKRKPHRAVRTGGPVWGVPQFRGDGCGTAFAFDHAKLGVNVKRWLRDGGWGARRQYEKAFREHLRRTGVRMVRGGARVVSSHSVWARSLSSSDGKGRLVLSTLCGDRGPATTHVSLKRERG